jgi:ubiquinone/menaquinone biosynthesis C-methylase UbiE
MPTLNFMTPIDTSQINYQQSRMRHWNAVARELETWKGLGGYYHQRLIEVYQSVVLPGQSVLEIGCARGELLAALRPSVGVGVDFSEEMINAARQRHPQLRFVHADAHALDLTEKFDVIILSDLVNDLWDVQTVLQQVGSLATPRTRIIINSYSGFTGSGIKRLSRHCRTGKGPCWN